MIPERVAKVIIDRMMAFWSVIIWGIVAVAVTVGILCGGYFTTVVGEILALIKGHVIARAASWQVAIGALSLQFILDMVAFGLLLLSVRRAERKWGSLAKMFCNDSIGGILGWLCLLAIIEELLFRWLPLGLTPLWVSACAQGSSWFYALLVTSAVLFSLVHVIGEGHIDYRQAGRAVLFFAAGIILAYVFLKAGLMWAIATHLATNMVLTLPLLFAKATVPMEIWKSVRADLTKADCAT